SCAHRGVGPPLWNSGQRSSRCGARAAGEGGHRHPQRHRRNVPPRGARNLMATARREGSLIHQLQGTLGGRPCHSGRRTHLLPWFGGKADDTGAPAHGFVRTTAWQLESIEQTGDAVTVSMFTESNVHTKRWWPADFRMAHSATFGSELTLVVANMGRTQLRFEEALHTYFRVGHID